MIDFLTRNPVFRFYKWLFVKGRDSFVSLTEKGDKGPLVIKVCMAVLFFSMASVFLSTWGDYRDAGTSQLGLESGPATELPPVAPIIWRGLSVVLALLGVVAAFLIRPTRSNRNQQRFIIIALWMAALAGLASWLPPDVIATQRALTGKALAGETPSIVAYFGQVVLVASLIISIPLAAWLYFRLSLMDRYVVQSFLSPFLFCLFSFTAIWVIADMNDHSKYLAQMKDGQAITYYIVQIPFVILFVMPIVMLLAGLFSLTTLSKSNELISMIGAGRSVTRILMPLFIIGLYSSMICLAFKFQWAPTSVGTSDAMMESARAKFRAKRKGEEVEPVLYSKRGWMHVNEPDQRTWFVGAVPLKLSDPMSDVVVAKLDDKGQPQVVWIAKRAKWVWNTVPPQWQLFSVTVYTYDAERIPRMTRHAQLTIDDWSETPWKVLSSAQNPEYLGMPGLTMYLDANADMNDDRLAAFRTNRWNIFAEPFTCFVMILVAAPLGVVYSRRGGMAGVTGAIILFAMMYLMRTTFIALGQGSNMGPFLAAWLTNFIIATIGLFLLAFRARNREIPKLRNLIMAPFKKRPAVPTA
ncbi:LptF/LptG family permease [Verrucomicrobiales bacterium]|nr:LptF/LptG family permease [Verrucomicrobiales bacterium]